jgi:hypothetical protein
MQAGLIITGACIGLVKHAWCLRICICTVWIADSIPHHDELTCWDVSTGKDTQEMHVMTTSKAGHACMQLCTYVHVHC